MKQTSPAAPASSAATTVEQAQALSPELRALAISYRALADSVNGALFRYLQRPDGSNCVEYLSPGCQALWELPPEAIEQDASQLWQMIDPEDLPAMSASVQASAHALTPWHHEWRITTPSGVRKWLEGRGRPQAQPDGSVLWNTLIFDISERRRTEQALRESEERLALALAATGEGVWDWDVPSGRVRHNQRWLQLMGLQDARLEHSVNDYVERVHPDDRPRVQSAIDAVLAHSSNFRMEYRLLPLGSVAPIWVQDRGNVVARDAQGRAIRVVGAIADISARKAAELQWRIRDAALKSALNGVALAGLDTRLTWVNPAFCRMWRMQPEQAIGRLAADFWRDPQGPAAAVQALRTRGRWLGSMVASRLDGSCFEVEVAATLVRDDEGQGVCMMASFSDVTSRNEAQRALQQLNAQLEARVAERTASLQAAMAEAERANQAKSEFLSAMSHELRMPLNAVLGFGQLLEREEGLSPRARGYVQQVLHGGQHVLALVGEVLDLARVEAGRLELHPCAVPLAPMLENCRQLLATMAREQGTLWLPALVPEDAFAWADETALRQVLLNLLSNAVKYGGRACTVTVSVSSLPGQRLAIAVADNGPGIPLQRLPSLFQPFSRLGAEHSGVPGTGLGLAITQRLVQHLQGSIRVRSEPGEGCCFTVELPAAPPG